MKLPFVGVTGFEPATTRPPDVYATGLRHTPIWEAKLHVSRIYARRKVNFQKSKSKPTENQGFLLLTGK